MAVHPSQSNGRQYHDYGQLVQSFGKPSQSNDANKQEEFAEAVFFSYGVVVFFGLDEGQEKGILEDIDGAGIMKRKMDEEKWEVEECHYSV